MPRPTSNLVGQRFGRLVAVERDRSLTGAAYWACVCDCGTQTVVPSGSLRSGGTRSCGCLRRETTIARSTKHGLASRASRTATYTSWQNMRRRCRPDHPRYETWGGRGIKVCDRWLDDYPAFLADMGEKPPGTTLERLDNNGNYEPGNCVWAPPVVQARNQRRTKLTAEKVLQIRELQAKGLSVTAITTATGVNRHTVGTVMTTLAAVRVDFDALMRKFLIRWTQRRAEANAEKTELDLDEELASLIAQERR